jgi:CubicO group peptidase (beta-lactamase class C family)
MALGIGDLMGLSLTLRLLPLLSVVVLATNVHGQSRSPASLDAVLRPYLSRYDLPALAAAIVTRGEIVAAGAVGTRRVGTTIPVSVEDRFHIGSDTKAMTSLLAATLVEDGKLSWSTTVREVFPELAPTMDHALQAVTLEQLLSHTSGIPSDTDAHDKLVQHSFTLEKRNLDELRYWIIQQLVTNPLQSKPGTQFAYANMGYVLAGAMLERVTGRTWEELIVERVFEPLGLKSAGLGPQSTLGRVDAPLGHESREGRPPKPLLAGPGGDNPEVIGPAGTAHMSVLDFARWAGWNASSGTRAPALLNPQSIRKLHTPIIEIPPKPDAPPGTPSAGSYGFGWLTMKVPLSREPFLFHGGSNQMNLADVLIQPKYDFAIVAMTNVGGRRADEALKALAGELYKSFGPAEGLPLQ